MGTIKVKDVAEAAGVGVGTASRALTGRGYVSPEKKEHVRRIAKEMGYWEQEPRPAGWDAEGAQKQPRTREGSQQPVLPDSPNPDSGGRKSGKRGKTPDTQIPALQARQGGRHMAGLILPDISSPVCAGIARYLELELDILGYRTVVCSSLGIAGRVREMLDLVEDHDLDGLVVCAEVDPEDIRRMERMPVVSYDVLLGDMVPVVASDHEAGGRMAAKTLLENQCRHVLLLGPRTGLPTASRRRFEACRKALDAGGARVITAEPFFDPYSSSAAAVRELVSRYLDICRRADGIFTGDMEALWCVREAALQGRMVPRDLKVVGYGGGDLPPLAAPELTTIAQNPRKLAHTLADVLLRRIGGFPTEREYLVGVDLVRGGSTL